MAGGKKVRKKNDRYLESLSPNEAHSPRNVYCSDKRLVPRIRECVRKSGVFDLDEVVASLQSTYPEYSRRKRHVFQNLVGRLYQSLGFSNDCHGDELLEEMERRHFEKRMKEANEEGEDSPLLSPVSEDDDEDDDEEILLSMELSLDPEVRNSANNQLLQLYKSGPEAAPELSTLYPMVEGPEGLVREIGAAAIGAAAVSVATTDSDNASEEAVISLNNAADTGKLNWQTVSNVTTVPAVARQKTTPKTPETTPTGTQQEATLTTTGTSQGTTPTGTQLGTTPTTTGTPQGTTPNISMTTTPSPSGLHSILKKVSFSTPEIGEQHQFEVAGESTGVHHSRTRKVKKRHRHHEGEVGDRRETGEATVKKRRTKERTETVGKDTLGKSEFKVQMSTVKFSDVGGCDHTLAEICKLLLHLRHPEVFSWLGVHPPQGFLLHGPPGCGKTLLAHAIAGELNIPFIKLAATEVVSGVSGESEGTLRDLFSLAKSHAPCILFVDEIDAICRKRETAQREMERRIVTQLLACLDDLNQSAANSRVLVIGATSSPDSLDPGLRRAGRFDREISLGIPDQKARESILKVLGGGLRLETNFSFTSISRETPGFVGADLVALVREASLCAVNRLACKDVTGDECGASDYPAVTNWLDQCATLSEEELSSIFITVQDFKEALMVVQPSAKREGFATVPDVTWEDVGALEAIREELSYAILAPVRYPEQFASLGLTRPPGVLLSGPPGCGKTLLAKAIANESGINFISVKGPELLNMYVGESERAVRQVFQRARNSAPCVIFFDELDALCPKRSDIAESSASSRVVNQLLTEMDGVVARKQVFIMGATNRPDIIDPAVIATLR